MVNSIKNHKWLKAALIVVGIFAGLVLFIVLMSTHVGRTIVGFGVVCAPLVALGVYMRTGDRPARRAAEQTKVIEDAGAPVGEAEARRMLDRAINTYAAKGYLVQSRGEFSAQLLKPKVFSAFWALAWFLVFGVGLVVYLIHYWSKRDQIVYLEVNPEQGKVTKLEGGGL